MLRRAERHRSTDGKRERWSAASQRQISGEPGIRQSLASRYLFAALDGSIGKHSGSTNLDDKVCYLWQVLGGDEPSAPHLCNGQARPMPCRVPLEEQIQEHG